MFDLSGTMEDHVKFLPGLKESRYAPKQHKGGNNDRSEMAIDPETGAVILVKNDDKVRMVDTNRYHDLEPLIEENRAEALGNEVDGVNQNTYADIMASEKKGVMGYEDEMDWE
jgi:hypothetical protein